MGAIPAKTQAGSEAELTRVPDVLLPDEFVAVWRPRLRDHFGDKVPASTGLSDREELAWLFGRAPHPELPVLAPWG